MTNISRPGKVQRCSFLIDGKPATQRELKRILDAPALPVDKDDRATKPLLNVARPFSILKRG